MTYDNTNRGAVWKAKERKTDKHPSHTGSINIEGIDYWLNGWVGTEQGKPSMTFSAKPKEAKEAPQSNDQEDIDSSIHFQVVLIKNACY